MSERPMLSTFHYPHSPRQHSGPPALKRRLLEVIVVEGLLVDSPLATRLVL